MADFTIVAKDDVFRLFRHCDVTAVDLWRHTDMGTGIETVSPEGTFCDTVQVPSGADDMQLI